MKIRWTLMAFALFACDSEPQTAPDAVETDVTISDTQEDTQGEETGSDVDDGPLQPCDALTCDTPPEDRCADDRQSVELYREGRCEEDEKQRAQCIYEPTISTCTGNEVCVKRDGAFSCAVPEQTCEVLLSEHATWIASLTLPNRSEPCCFDFDGDNQVDNGLREILRLMEANPQGFLDEFTARGRNSFILEYEGLADLSQPQQISANLLIGFQRHGPPEGLLDKLEPFEIRDSGYDGPQPLSRFDEVTIEDGRLIAHAERLDFPLAVTENTPFFAQLEDVRLEAEVQAGPGGRGLRLGGKEGEPGARFGALMPRSEVIRAVNAFVDEQCGCLDIHGPSLITPDGDDYTCQRALSSACSKSDTNENTCIELANHCWIGVPLLQPDVGEYVSLGVWIQGGPADLQGFVDTKDKQLTCQ